VSALLRGTVLVLGGLLLPVGRVLGALVGPARAHAPELVAGALVFKAGLVALGLLAWGLARAGFWRAGGGPRVAPAGRGEQLALAAILTVAAALRLHALDGGLWYDEIATWLKYARLPFGDLLTTYDSEGHHPLYSLLAHAAFLAFGESAWALRLPAALFGVAGVAALYLLGCEVTSRGEALLAAAVLAVSYHHVWFSQNARGYTALLFWTLLASWALLRALRGAPRYWLLHAVAVALGAYTHVTMLFVAAAHGLVYLAALVRRRGEAWPDRWAGLAAGFLLGAVLTVELYAFMLPQMTGTIGEASNVADWKSPVWTVLEAARGLRAGPAGGVAVVAALAVLGAGVASYARSAPVLLHLLVAPCALGAIVVLAMHHPLWPRFFFFALGFGVLVLVRGAAAGVAALARLAGAVPPLARRLGTAACLAIAAVSLATVPAAYRPKQDFDGALRFVEAHRAAGDTVVTVGLATYPYRAFFNTGWEAADTLEALRRIRARAARTWLLYTIPLHLRFERPDLMREIERDFTVVRSFAGSLGDGTIFVCLAQPDGRRP
jgi:hypothetical protein